MADNPSGYNPYLRQPFAWDDSQDSPIVFDSANSFVGGQFSYAKARLLGPTQAALLNNCEVAITGQASTRFGTVQLGGNVSAGSNVTALIYYNTAANAYEVALDSAGNVYKQSGGTWTALVAGNINGSDIPTVIQGNNKLYLAGGNFLYSFDGTTYVQLDGDGVTQAPRLSSILLWHTNRLIAAGPHIKSLSTDPSTVSDAVYFSNVLDGATWGFDKNSVQIRVGAGDGLAITAMVGWTNFNIAVFKRHSVWVIMADPTLNVSEMPTQLIHSRVGCVAQKSAVQVGSDILFLSDDGVRSLAQVQGSDQQHELGVPLSYPVQDVIHRINWNAATDAASVFWRNLYITALPLDGSTTNNFLLVFNTVEKTWSGTWTNLPVKCFAVRESGGISRLMMGLATSPKVIEYLDYVNPANWVDSTFQDYDSSTVQPNVRTKALTYGDPIGIKLAQGGEIEWNNSKGALTITPIIDEVAQTPLPSINIASGGFTPPITPAFLIAPNGLSRSRFDMMSYGEFRELQFDIIGTGAGRKEIRQINIAGVLRPTLIGQS